MEINTGVLKNINAPAILKIKFSLNGKIIVLTNKNTMH